MEPLHESYDEKIRRITMDIIAQRYHQSGKKRVTMGMRVENILRKEFPDKEDNE